MGTTDGSVAAAVEDTGAGTRAAPRAAKHLGRRIFLKVPLFLYMFVVYLVIEAMVPNVRDIVVSHGNYRLTWVEVIYLAAIVMAMTELLRVSKPGVDNTVEALLMLGAWIVYLVCFLLSIGGTPALAVFNNTEFLMLLLISATQVVLAFMINARTLKRTIDYTADDNR